MKKIAVTAAAVFAVALLGMNIDTASAKDAKANYDHYCAQCHGTSGKGDGVNNTKDLPVSPRNHTDANEMKKLTDADVYNAIKDGGAATSKSTLMPPFGETLSDAELKDMVKYIRKLCGC